MLDLHQSQVLRNVFQVVITSLSGEFVRHELMTLFSNDLRILSWVCSCCEAISIAELNEVAVTKLLVACNRGGVGCVRKRHLGRRSWYEERVLV